MRKYYRLTDLGRQEFAVEKERWFDVHAALKKFCARAEALD